MMMLNADDVDFSSRKYSPYLPCSDGANNNNASRLFCCRSLRNHLMARLHVDSKHNFLSPSFAFFTAAHSRVDADVACLQ